MRDRITTSGLATAFTNLSLAVLYAAFAFSHVQEFRSQPRASILLFVLLETLFALFFVARRQASATSTSLTAWASTLAGTFLPLLLRPAQGAEDVLLGQVVQAAGSAMTISGVLSLNRSLGLLPANRGVRSGGAYRLVRHPLYASYVVTHAGYVTSNFTTWNVAIALAAFAAQLVRIRGEEEFLSRDPEYAAYRARTRWRLIPFVY
jgi:protein-S-isoprenylcysteine O-methyltransferase Ste14